MNDENMWNVHDAGMVLVSIISDNYFKFNLKAESKFTYKKTIKKTMSKLQLWLYNVPLIVMESVY
jgi:hypothetical protein